VHLSLSFLAVLLEITIEDNNRTKYNEKAAFGQENE
jgi:hypothetical protein